MCDTCVYSMMDRTDTCLLLLLLSLTTIAQCMLDCADKGITDCQVVDSSECQAALSVLQGQPYGYQLHANIAASFVNLTVMVDNSVPETHRRTLRMVLNNWLGPEQIRLKGMLILLMPLKETSQWSKCLKIKFPTDVTHKKDTSFSILIPTHRDISTYRMTVVSTFLDNSGHVSVGQTKYLIKMSDLTTNRDWILPVIAYTQTQDKVIFSITPPSVLIHQNILTCSAWLITCGGQQTQLLVSPEGNEPDEADKADVEKADEWGMGSCLYYEHEVLLKSSINYPILDMKLPKGKYQIWIDCVLQNQLASWPSTTKTIRTPTFTHQGNKDFFMKLQWKDNAQREDHGVNIQQYTQHTEYRQSLKSDSTSIHPDGTLEDKDRGNNLILGICLTSVFLSFVAIGAIVFCKIRTNQKKVNRMFKDNSCDDDTKTMTLVPCPHVKSQQESIGSSNLENCEVSTAESSLNLDKEVDSYYSSYIPKRTPPLLRYQQTPIDITTSCSIVLNVHESDDFDYDEHNEHGDGLVDMNIPVQLSKRCSSTRDALHYSDQSFIHCETNIENNSTNTQGRTQEDTGYFSSKGDPSNKNDNSSLLEKHSYNHELLPIKYPKLLSADVRIDSVNFNDLLRGFNSDFNDWRFKEKTTDQSGVTCIKDDCISVGEPVLW